MEDTGGSQRERSELLAGVDMPGSGPCEACSHSREDWDRHCYLMGSMYRDWEAPQSVRAFCEARSVLKAAFNEISVTRSRQERLSAIRPPARMREARPTYRRS